MFPKHHTPPKGYCNKKLTIVPQLTLCILLLLSLKLRQASPRPLKSLFLLLDRGWYGAPKPHHQNKRFLFFSSSHWAPWSGSLVFIFVWHRSFFCDWSYLCPFFFIMWCTTLVEAWVKPVYSEIFGGQQWTLLSMQLH